jgi:hypothetical protein
VLSGTIIVSVPAILLFVMIKCWSSGKQVLSGMMESYDAFQLPFGILLLALVLHIIFIAGSKRGRAVLFIVMLSLPVFFYLKGAEQMGLWSQRRIITPLLILTVVVVDHMLSLVGRISRKSFVPYAVTGIVLFAGLWNAIHWPAIYIGRYEKGADKLVYEVKKELAGKVAFFDYHTYSVPFTVAADEKIYGLSQGGYDGLPDVINWLRTQSLSNNTVLVSAYANPGMEDGVSLTEYKRISRALPRILAKTSLPAVKDKYVFDIRFCKVQPVIGAEIPDLSRIMDNGWLCLRGPWGTTRVGLDAPDGKVLSARWSREGSTFIGPVPQTGRKVTFRMIASACRIDGVALQEVLLYPPWSDQPYEIIVTNGYSDVSAVLERTSGKSESEVPAGTGRYHIRTSHPYDPAKCGISGFDDDLGVLIHRIDMTAVK